MMMVERTNVAEKLTKQSEENESNFAVAMHSSDIYSVHITAVRTLHLSLWQSHHKCDTPESRTLPF